MFASTDKTVGQDDARMRLAVLLRRQTMVAAGELSQSSGALIAGQTGTGKTSTVRAMASHCGLPFAEVNATQYTDKGYVGMDMSQMFLPLIASAITRKKDVLTATYGSGWESALRDANPASILQVDSRILDPAIEEAETGVVLLDEVDKWMQAGSDPIGRNVGRKLQAELLKMIEGGEVYVTDSEDEIGMAFDTTRVLIICAGAFIGLHKHVSKRLGKSIGLNVDLSEMIQPEDFISFGFLPELAGRLTTHIVFKPLTAVGMVEILRQEDGVVSEYVQRFAQEGVELVITEEGLLTVAHNALSRQVGARGLAQALDRTFGKALYEAAVKGRGKVILDVSGAQREEVHVIG